MTGTSSWKRPFFIIAAGQTASLIGSSAVQFTMIWWLASETDSPMMMALAGLTAFLPQLFLGPFAGVWIDRWKRKYVVICADLFIGLVALAFAVCFHLGAPPYWSVCAVLGIRAVGSVFHTPAIQAVIPMLVPREELVRANGWSQFMQSGAFMLGPVLGAAMYGFLPMPVILMTDFLGALIASVTVAVVSLPECPASAGTYPDFWREFKEGIAVYRRDRQLSLLLFSATVSMVFILPLSSLYPLMTSSYFQASAFHASAVDLAYAGGMMTSSFIVGLFGKVRRKLRMAYFGLLGVGVNSLLCGFLPPHMWAFWIFMALCGLLGASSNFYNISCVAYMQEYIPSEAQGMAFSLLGSVMSLAMPVGLLLSGPVAERYGVSAWFFITGICISAVTLPCMLAGERRP